MANEVDYSVDLPGGGSLRLKSADEVEMWNTAHERYIEDYAITKQNDKVLLGALLSQQLVLFRAQKKLSDPKQTVVNAAHANIRKAAEEIREIEKSLGIDKKAREAGGQHTVANYVETLKKFAHAKGIHISERVKAYEALAMEARWRIRLWRNGDAEDRQYHQVASPKAIVEWLERELAAIEEKDKEWAREQGAVFVGRV